jgi:hypothetical protein
MRAEAHAQMQSAAAPVAVHALPRCAECGVATSPCADVQTFLKNGVVQCVVPGAWLAAGVAPPYLWPVTTDPAPLVMYKPARLDRVLVGRMWPTALDAAHCVCAVGVVCGAAAGAGADALVPVEVVVAMHAALQLRRVYAVPLRMLAQLHCDAAIALTRALRRYSPDAAAAVAAHADPPRPRSPSEWART